jgi:mRNA interferase MazF
MRPIHLVQLDKTRPAVVLTRPAVRERLRSVTVAPITSRIRGLSIEVRVGQRNGLEVDSVINCDNVATIDARLVGRAIGVLQPDQEDALARAIVMAFDLDLDW